LIHFYKRQERKFLLQQLLGLVGLPDLGCLVPWSGGLVHSHFTGENAESWQHQ